VFVAGDVVDGQLDVLYQPGLDIVSASDDPEQAEVSGCLIVGILDKHPHFAADALERHTHRSRSVEKIRIRPGCCRRRTLT
jgi:hypothetical protein